jgi:hypothetical protein
MKLSRHGLFSLVFFGLLLLIQPKGVLAIPGDANTFVSVVGNAGAIAVNTNFSQSGTDPAVSHAFLSSVTIGNPVLAVFSGDAFASATVGTLRAISSGTLSTSQPLPVFPVNFDSDAVAHFSDGLAVSGPGVAFVSATGTISGVGSGFVGVGLQNLFNVFGPGPHNGACSTTISTSVIASASCTTTPVVAAGPGFPLLLSETMSARVTFLQPSGSVSALSDFSDTGFISLIQAFDINGNPLTDFSVVSASGVVYPTGQLGATPEPTTLLLFGTSAVGLGLVRWRQRRRQRQA